MDKLSDITLENTVTVKIDYQLNSEVVGKNFTIIMDCLKDLKANQDGYSDKFNQMLERLDSVEKNMKENSNNNTNSK